MSEAISLREQYFKNLLKNPDDLELLKKNKSELLLKSKKSNYLYKYCGINTALQILSSSSVMLQSPDNFNDPFDCLSSVGIWNQKYTCDARNEDLEYLKNLLQKLPTKFNLPKYELDSDLRASYAFAISCFTSDHKNPLMWAHYANQYKGICLEFNISDLITLIHPCFYVNSMPEINWRSITPNLALIKGYPWAYEEEWRLVKETIRPKMRLWGDISNQIYVHVHTNGKFSQEDYKEYSKYQTTIVQELEDKYNSERKFTIWPSKIYLGTRFYMNYGNEDKLDICDKIFSIAKETKTPLHLMKANHQSFELQDIDITNLSRKQLNNPALYLY